MGDHGSNGNSLRLRALFVAAAALGIAIGMALPGPHKSQAEPRSQFATFEVGRG